MSTAHMSYDDYGFPHTTSPHPPPYDISYGLGGIPLHSSAVYPPSHLDASTSSTHPGLLSSHPPPDSTYSSFFPTQHDHFVAQQYLSGAGNVLLNHHAPLYPARVLRQPSPSPRPHPHSQPHPHPIYNAGHPSAPDPAYVLPTSEWNGNIPYPAHYDPVGSAAAYVRGLTDIIDSSHTVQSQQASLASHVPEQQHLSGSLDPNTGEFHRTVEHPRLRTAQACEKCRIRKAKCTGETPCSRCLSRGLQCEYAPERKMRGPNKNKRVEASPKPDKAKPRQRKDTATSEPCDSSSDGHASDNSSPPACASRSSSTHSSPAPPPPRLIAPLESRGRPRAATLGLGAIGRLESFHNSAAGPSRGHQFVVPSARPRPPAIDLASEREYVPRMMTQHVGVPEEVPLRAQRQDSRPTSLPSYLIDSYSRVALKGEDASSQSSGYDSRPPSQDMSHFMSDSPASSSDMSTPISPMSLNFETEFQYSEHIPSDFGHFVGDAGPEHPFGDDVHLFEHHDDLLRPKSVQSIVHHGWDALHNDDRTPRGLDNADMLMYP
ncbi:hypothetical protein OH76DRAFT_1457770 [Lentinus brumalis]|uniref:Zn(2)-C6 fungal-type domain-containing protein n=1 Tax=Lentinus brumalis TaxID=2498619 RepID=A0A371CXL9_9APHY|nr:hypothetical protein OH76DRAFT_1457770 [Polyporus brumalis]